MSECTHDCSSCGENCSSRQEPQDMLEPLYEKSNVKKVIGVVSGKGGVGKSMTTSLLAVAANRKGLHTGILDGDVTGPSIPQSFGLHERLLGNADGIIMPAMTNLGIEVVSVNLMLEEETQPVIWRGPVVTDVVKQFWGKTLWRDIDVMFVDMPPGTGEVPLTVFQSMPLDGIVVVATPQDLVGMIVEKAVNMAKMMDVPILGLVENMSYIKCPDCGKEIRVFGESKIEAIGDKYQVPVLGKLPIDPKLTEACDNGLIENLEEIYLNGAIDALL
ncbi:MAG: Mrp/NBP35 family ATP-binding protein [Anaerostipes sp.]|nr:Mrp/NBP35 family ATP-binding protein [Anaerostipes sp.]